MLAIQPHALLRNLQTVCRGSYARTHARKMYLRTSFLAGHETRPDRSKPSNGGTAGAWASPCGDAVFTNGATQPRQKKGGEGGMGGRGCGQGRWRPRKVQKLPRKCCSDPVENRSDTTEERSETTKYHSGTSSRTAACGNMRVLVGLLKASGRTYRKNGHRQAVREREKRRMAAVPLMECVFAVRKKRHRQRG